MSWSAKKTIFCKPPGGNRWLDKKLDFWFLAWNVQLCQGSKFLPTPQLANEFFRQIFCWKCLDINYTTAFLTPSRGDGVGFRQQILFWFWYEMYRSVKKATFLSTPISGVVVETKKLFFLFWEWSVHICQESNFCWAFPLEEGVLDE